MTLKVEREVELGNLVAKITSYSVEPGSEAPNLL
jgi:hypothetical protein